MLKVKVMLKQLQVYHCIYYSLVPFSSTQYKQIELCQMFPNMNVNNNGWTCFFLNGLVTAYMACSQSQDFKIIGKLLTGLKLLCMFG